MDKVREEKKEIVEVGSLEWSNSMADVVIKFKNKMENERRKKEKTEKN